MNLPSPGSDSILPCYLQAYGQCEWKRRERVEETGVYTTPCHRDSQIRTVEIHAGSTASVNCPTGTAPPFRCKAMFYMTRNM